jgi:DNA-directed RNA polymerase specialized sigma24 family protein
LTLFYMEDCSYKDIAEILEVPLGTVQSRISRGLAQLQELVQTRGLAGKAVHG